MKLISLSSRLHELLWKFASVYVVIFVLIGFSFGVLFLHWDINNPQFDQQSTRELIREMYAAMGVAFVILSCSGWLHSRFVRIQVDEQSKIVFVDGVEQDISHLKYVSEVIISGTLLVFIKRQGRLQVWIPKGAVFSPLPFFIRKTPRNKNVKLFVSLLGSPSKG